MQSYLLLVLGGLCLLCWSALDIFFASHLFFCHQFLCTSFLSWCTGSVLSYLVQMSTKSKVEHLKPEECCAPTGSISQATARPSWKGKLPRNIDNHQYAGIAVGMFARCTSAACLPLVFGVAFAFHWLERCCILMCLGLLPPAT